MLKLSMLEFFIRGIPEAFLFIFSVFVFSKTKIRKKEYVLLSFIYAVIVYFIRLLPILYGVNNILLIILAIIITVFLGKIDIVKTIKAVIISVIIQFVCEGINIFIIMFIMKKDMNYIFNEPSLKTIYGLPSLLLFGLVVAIYYKLLKGKESNYESNI